MSDGGQQQRVLDLIDDPNALESFLGGLTSDSELLPTADSVDNVVASLARSLENEYEVDSPNETLFDTLDPSSNNLTDISQSYVPSDFENAIANAAGSQQGFNNAMTRNGEVSHHQHQGVSQQTIQDALSSIVTSGVEQFLMNTSHTTNANASNLQQFTSGNCDPSSNNSSQFIQQQQLQMNQSQVMLETSNTSYSYSEEIIQKQTVVNQSQQMTSLSNSSLTSQQNNSSMTSTMISMTPTTQNSNGQQMISSQNFQQPQTSDAALSQTQQQQVSTNSESNLNSSGNGSATSGTVSSASNGQATTTSTPGNSTSTPTLTTSAQTQQIQSPFSIQTSSSSSTQQQQTTSMSQIVSSGQAVMNVGGAQLLTTSTGNIVQQIQTGGGQSFITLDQQGFVAGPSAFGTNLVLAGGAPTYAVVNTGTSFLSNAIMTQPQTIQTLMKGPNGTFVQTSGGTQIVAASNVSQMSNVTNVSVANNSNSPKPKQPPQLLPKPQSNSAVNSTIVNESETNVSGVPSSSSSGTQSQTDGVITQIFQPSQGITNQVVVTSVGNTVIPQQTFTIGNAAGLGQVSQVMVSQNPTQQTQLTGTIVVNQYGQPMLVPSAGQPGLQFFVRPQAPVFQFQAQPGAAIATSAASGGKPVVRYISQLPQTPGGYGLQQIQTPNGPAWVAVRYPQATATIATTAAQISQFQGETVQSTNIVPASANPLASSSQPLTPSQPQKTNPRTTPSPAPSTPQPATPQPSTPSSKAASDVAPDSSSEPPPAKKAKPRPKPKKKEKVTLDLEQLLKQSGITTEDGWMEDDSFDFFNFSESNQNGFDSSFADSSNTSIDLQSQQSDSSTAGKGKASPKKKSGAGSSKKKKRPKSPSPPPPPPPPPSSSKSKKKKGGNSKADSKTENSKSDPPKKLSSLDDISATIDAVASACSPSPPPSPSSSLPFSSPARSSTPATPAAPQTPNSPAIVPSIKPATPMQIASSPAPPSIAASALPSVSTQGLLLAGTPNGIGPVSALPNFTNHPPGTTRIVQTIQLTPQNQQLLRNIQAQITRLLSLPKRNENEQSALQKLITLQQQVIATGIPVPNPAHLSNLTQNLSSSNASTSVSIPSSLLSSVGVIFSGDSSVPVPMTSSNSTTFSIPQQTPSPQVNSLTLSINNQNAKILPKPDVSNIDLTGNFLETMSKVVDIPKPETQTVAADDNKENSTRPGSNLLVASSNLASGTSTTSSLGHLHEQPYPPSYRTSTLDDKKVEEQRITLLKGEEEKRSRWKKEEIEMLLKRDQQCVTQPDYEIPFSSKRDAVERLMKYHILRDRNDMNFSEFDNEFGEKAVVLLDKFHGMRAKYRSLLLKESMKEVGSAERVMLERMFVTEEKMKLEQDRLLVNQGEVLELPPPPLVWVPKIQEMVDEEMKDLEENSMVNMQVQSAIDSIIGFGNMDVGNSLYDENESKQIEYDAFGVPINNNNGGYGGLNASSADIDEAVRSILS